MNYLTFSKLVAGVGLATASTATFGATVPHLVAGPDGAELIVQDRPFLVLGGEVRNSSSSSLEFMQGVWPGLASLHLNTVLVPVSWEQLEPTEGMFDFSLVDGLIQGARVNHLHLVFLWFGTWKNMVSSYEPRWVRADPVRFPLTIDETGDRLPIPSTFAENTLRADANAFRHLLRHIRQIDEASQTVIMVQVENEVGLPDATRDYSAVAQAAFAAPIPGQLADRLKNHAEGLTRELRASWEKTGARPSGTWTEVFGPGPLTNELFTAWHYARYINTVAEAGAAEYPLPLFVNAAIGRQDGKVGSYPGGGALPAAFDLWHLAAPAIAILSPDIYYGSFSGWCSAYSQSANPLFIPETKADEAVAANAVVALGAWKAVGFSPFAIDAPFPASQELGQLYGLLDGLSPAILGQRTSDSIAGVAVGRDSPKQTVRLGKYLIEVSLRHGSKTLAAAERGYLCIIADRPDHFLALGKDVEVTWTTDVRPASVVELDKVEEGTFQAGKWRSGRRLNGDEIMLDYSLAKLAAVNRTGTGLRFDGAGPSLLSVQVFCRPAGN